MPVFDFSDTPDKRIFSECTYTTFRSNQPSASPEQPILVLDNHQREWKHHFYWYLY